MGLVGTLRFDWVSLGVAIGYSGDSITPSSLLTITRSNSAPQVGAARSQPNAAELLDLGMLIIGGFRVYHASNQTYIDKLQDALKKQLTTPELREGLEVTINNLAAVYVETELIKLLCAIDLFIAMFPKHPLSKLRFGTLILSYKDCTGLSAIGHVCELMSHSTKLFARWLMIPTLRNDLNRMNIPGQEITIPYSYSAYMSGLGLVDKSPYSAALNCGIHMFVRLVGCAIPLARSVYAIYFQPSGLCAIIDNAVLFIYAHSCTSSLQMQFYKKKEVESIKLIEKDAKRQIEAMRDQLMRLAEEEGNEGLELEDDGVGEDTQARWYNN